MNAWHSWFRPSPLAAAKLAVLAAIFSCASPMGAQIANRPVPTPVQSGPQILTKEKLGRLLAPIALYPDALIALILPASTVPADVVLAARYLKSSGDAEHAENQPWDESVKSLTRYPEVLAWMDQNLEWTASLGEAFVEQPADVMSAVQALRQQAKATGNLADTPQQKVVEEESAIRIVPADPEVIYVPQYDPQVVYIQSYTTVPFVTFGVGCAVGTWLSYDFDWNRRCFYRGNWRGGNRSPGGNRGGADLLNIDANDANPWQPSANARRQMTQRQANNNGNARYVGSSPGVAGTGQQVVPGTAGNPARRPANDNSAPNSVPQPSTPRRFSGDAGQIPARVGVPANIPPSNPAVPTAVAPAATPNVSRSNVPSVNQPHPYTPRIQQPEHQPVRETPQSRYQQPQVQQPQVQQPQVQQPQQRVPQQVPSQVPQPPQRQQLPQQVPQQRPAAGFNSQPQQQPAPVMNPPGVRQPPGPDTRRSSGER